MPFLSIQTNSTLLVEQQSALLDAAAKIVATELGKPEDYVMVSLVPVARMRFVGEESPTAFLELMSIGIPDSKRNALAAALTDLVARSCEIKRERVFSAGTYPGTVLELERCNFWVEASRQAQLSEYPQRSAHQRLMVMTCRIDLPSANDRILRSVPREKGGAVPR